MLTCRKCGSRRKLIKKNKLYPEFLVRFAKDEKEAMRLVKYYEEKRSTN